MSTSKLVILAAAMAAALSCGSTSNAHTCSVTKLEVESSGDLDFDNRVCTLGSLGRERQ